MGSRWAVIGIALTAACFVGGCTSAQRKAIDREMSPPAVDLRAVPGGVEVGFVCGAGTPLFSDVDVLGPNNEVKHVVSHIDSKHAPLSRTVVLPVPAAWRNTRLSGDVALNAAARAHGFPIYVFTFRYRDLPHDAPVRIPGSAC